MLSIHRGLPDGHLHLWYPSHIPHTYRYVPTHLCTLYNVHTTEVWFNDNTCLSFTGSSIFLIANKVLMISWEVPWHWSSGIKIIGCNVAIFLNHYDLFVKQSHCNYSFGMSTIILGSNGTLWTEAPGTADSR